MLTSSNIYELYTILQICVYFQLKKMKIFSTSDSKHIHLSANETVLFVFVSFLLCTSGGACILTHGQASIAVFVVA